MSFFGTILTTLVTIQTMYVFIRIYSLPVRKKFISDKMFIITAFLLWLLYFFSRLLGGHETTAEIILEFAGMHWMGIVFLLAAGFFIADLLTGFGFFIKRSVPSIRSSALIIGILLVIIAHIQGIRSPVGIKYDVFIGDLQENLEGTTIAVLSDFHAGEMMINSRWINNCINITSGYKPDIIVLVGDIFERASEPDDMIPVMLKLEAPMGIFAVRGNHDSLRSGRRDVFGEIMDGAGIRVLSNEWSEIADGLIVAGVEDLTYSRRRNGDCMQNIESALLDRPEGITLFLSHTPWLTDIVANHGVDLMISGHTHDGQIWPFNYLVKSVYPHISGKYKIDGLTLIVSRGTGTWGPRMRLWNPGEISIITLHKK